MVIKYKLFRFYTAILQLIVVGWFFVGLAVYISEVMVILWFRNCSGTFEGFILCCFSGSGRNGHIFRFFHWRIDGNCLIFNHHPASTGAGRPCPGMDCCVFDRRNSESKALRLPRRVNCIMKLPINIDCVSI